MAHSNAVAITSLQRAARLDAAQADDRVLLTRRTSVAWGYDDEHNVDPVTGTQRRYKNQ